MLGLDAIKGFDSWRKEDHQLNNFNDDMLIVGMSATASEAEQSDGFDHGMHFYSPKPFDLDLLGLILEKRRSCSAIMDCTKEICDAVGLSTSSRDVTRENSTESKTTEIDKKSTSRRDKWKFFRFRSTKVAPI
jgi:DNA-binding response OmpR family regulator